VVLLPLDVTDDGAVYGVLERPGGIDVLVNNAGIGSSGARPSRRRCC
jgi:NAD(P)-dependent dehydrogenase (short-subunit alcohol dehydrogenase family)